MVNRISLRAAVAFLSGPSLKRSISTSQRESYSATYLFCVHAGKMWLVDKLCISQPEVDSSKVCVLGHQKRERSKK